MFNRLLSRWPFALGLSGLLLLAGGPQHPAPHLDLDFDQSTALMLDDPGWIPSHALMLASFICLLIGLIGLRRSQLLTGRLATIGRIAIVRNVSPGRDARDPATACR